MRHIISAAIIAVIAAIGGVFAGESADHPPQQAATAPLADGEIRKVDKEAKKLTIRHGPIQNLDMPPMTMVFQVSDPAVLDKVKAGDKIRFSAEKQGGSYVATRVEPAQ